MINFHGFLKFNKNKKLLDTIFIIWSIHELSLGFMSHKNFGPDRFSLFDNFWIQTDRQTDKKTERQAKYYLLRFQEYFNCENVLLVYIVKLKQTKYIKDFIAKFRWFSIFLWKSNFVLGQFLQFWSSMNLSWGHVRSHTKFSPNRFSCYDVHWIQTDRQINRLEKYWGRGNWYFLF